MHEKSLRIPETVLEQLRCSFCNKYLSCSPLRVLPEGSTLCGRCADNDGCRVVVLETILNMFAFPCVFNQRGCQQELRFNEANDHEACCVFRSFPCPLTPDIPCKWTGPSTNFITHFKEKHYSFIWKKSTFKLCVNESSQGTFMCVEANVSFVITFSYNSATKLLRYDVCYCSGKAIDSSYQIQLVNDQDPDCSISLKSRKCLQYCNSQNESCLNLHQYLKNLENPSRIEVVVLLQQKQSVQNIDVSYNVLNSLKCGDCCNYLIPPVYDLDEHIICSDCGRRNPHCVLSNNEKIKTLVEDVRYPCRWRECKDVVKSDKFKLHELKCKYRHYDCFFPTCKTTFKIDSAIEHLESHRAVYMPDGISYKTKFEENNFKHVFTIKDNVLFVIQYSVVEIDGELVHRIALFTSNPNYVMGNVDFEHEHCKLKSRLFLLVSDHNTSVSLNQLPPCFKNDDDLFATVNILGDKAVPTLKDASVPALVSDIKSNQY
ncbi:hypothetical protein RN001_014160 [Aquatica leii]|uniref:RING-type E3 ubiquitin transferase n=1 Tax=Aquatica leii TaxID=1421715 RepID=A0AAN7SP02_9COLE|nr:hypothetical protein RN001_014160 [Aquatica leii]